MKSRGTLDPVSVCSNPIANAAGGVGGAAVNLPPSSAAAGGAAAAAGGGGPPVLIGYIQGDAAPTVSGEGPCRDCSSRSR